MVVCELGGVERDGNGGKHVKPMWLELELERDGQAIKISARGCRGERVAPAELGPLKLGRLTGLASGVRRCVAKGTPLPERVLGEARELYTAVFSEGVRDLMHTLSEAARASGRPLLVRLMTHSDELQRIPWEVMCKPESARGFVGLSPEFTIARGVNSNHAYEIREVRRAVRILAISPLGESDKLTVLRSALEQSIKAGEVQWLEPIVGEQTAPPHLFERLRSSEPPHIIHWLGHGGVDEQANPRLALPDDSFGEKRWILAETLAQELRTRLGIDLRLVVLEACSGARPGAFASAAELLARDGADAVIAHLWPVKADVAREISATFYRALTGCGDTRGNAGASLQATRRTFIERGAEVFSPVLYLRGPSSQLFDFHRRRTIAAVGPNQAEGRADPALHSLLSEPYSLVFGSTGIGLPGQTELVANLRKRLADLGDDPAELHRRGLSSLAQHFFLRSGQSRLSRVFQKSFGALTDMPVLPFVRAIARSLKPGAHTTLLWLPLLEQALAEAHPDRTIYAIQPAAPGMGESRLVMVRHAGQTQWEEDDFPPPDVDLTNVYMVLRVYGGYSPEPQPVLTTTRLTEDDHIEGLLNLRDMFPRDWECQFVGWMRQHTILCVGLSVLEWRHRMLLRWFLDDRPPSRVSVAIIDPSSGEQGIWDRGAGGLFGRGAIRAVAMNTIRLAETIKEVLGG